MWVLNTYKTLGKTHLKAEGSCMPQLPAASLAQCRLLFCPKHRGDLSMI